MWVRPTELRRCAAHSRPSHDWALQNHVCVSYVVKELQNIGTSRCDIARCGVRLREVADGRFGTIRTGTLPFWLRCERSHPRGQHCRTFTLYSVKTATSCVNELQPNLKTMKKRSRRHRENTKNTIVIRTTRPASHMRRTPAHLSSRARVRLSFGNDSRTETPHKVRGTT